MEAAENPFKSRQDIRGKIMADIKIQSNDEDLELKFKFHSPQSFSYEVSVINNNGIHIFHDSGNSWEKKDFILGKAKDLLGCGLKISWSIIDNNGAGYDYSAEAVVIQNGVECDAHQTVAGKTEAGPALAPSFGLFI